MASYFLITEIHKFSKNNYFSVVKYTHTINLIIFQIIYVYVNSHTNHLSFNQVSNICNILKSCKNHLPHHASIFFNAKSTTKLWNQYVRSHWMADITLTIHKMGVNVRLCKSLANVVLKRTTSFNRSKFP